MALQAPPLRDPIAVVVGEEFGRVAPPSKATKWPAFTIGREWLDHIFALSDRVDIAPERRAHVSLTAQGASIATTALPLASIPPGLYRVSYYVQVTRVGSVSSSVQFTLAWTARGQAQTHSGAAEAGNLLTTRQFGTLYIRSDENTPISYSTTYADGGGATSMQYSFDISCELVKADET